MNLKYSNAILIEDDVIWGKIIIKIIASYCEKITYYRNKKEAHSMLTSSNSKFDLSIADIRLEENDYKNSDGLFILEELKKQERVSRPIVITNFPNDDYYKRVSKINGILLEKGDFTEQEFLDILSIK